MLLTPAPFTPPSSPNGQHCWRFDGDFVDILAFLCEMVLNRPSGAEMLLHSEEMESSEMGTRFSFVANWGWMRMLTELENSPTIPHEGLVYLGTTHNPCWHPM
jgi:hypothetical protein